MTAPPLALTLVLGAALIALATPVGAAPAGGEASAKAFVQKLYSKHAPAEAAVYDAPMLTLIRRDRHHANGEVGALDFDPFCQCQDDGGMKAEVLDAHAAGKTAVVHVRLTFALAQPVEIIPVEYDLVRVGSGWRVHDIKSKTTPSLRAFMLKYGGKT